MLAHEGKKSLAYPTNLDYMFAIACIASACSRQVMMVLLASILVVTYLTFVSGLHVPVASKPLSGLLLFHDPNVTLSSNATNLQ